MMTSLEETRRWMMKPIDIFRYTCVVHENRRKDGWKGGANVAEVFKRAVVVEMLGELGELGE